MGFLDLSAESSPEVALHPKSSAVDAQEDEAKRADSGKKDLAVFVSKHVSALQTVEGFLDALTNANRCGKVSAVWEGRRRGGDL